MKSIGWSRGADIAVAVIVAWIIGYAMVDPPGPSSWWPGWAAWPVAAVMSLPVAVRRHRPRVMLALACATGVLATVTGAAAAGVVWLSFLPAVLVLYLVASTASATWSVAGLVTCAVAAVTAILLFYGQVLPDLTPASAPTELPPAWPIEAGIITVLLVAAWAVGAAVRWKRDTTARLVHHLADLAVADERRRIARELHDVIGHSMSLIAVKATVANHVADARPEEVRAALDVIEQTSRSTLTEIHRVLGLLRSDGDPPQELVPAPGLSGLPELVAHARAAGVEVSMTVRQEGEVPPTVALSIYRIVQQSLTNVVTHAGPTHCYIDVDIDGREARIEVIDDGPQPGLGSGSRHAPRSASRHHAGSGSRHDARSGSRQDASFGSRHDFGPGCGDDSGVGSRLDAGSGSRQDAGSGSRQDAGFGSRHEVGSGCGDDSGVGSRLDAGSGSRQDAGSGSRQDAGSGSRQDAGFGSRHDLGSGSGDDFGVGSRHDAASGSRRDLGSGSRHSLGSGLRHDVGSGSRHDLGFGSRHDAARLGRSPRGDRNGHGLIGMRERVKMYGGTFSAGRRPEGGFRVMAHLPYDESGTTA